MSKARTQMKTEERIIEGIYITLLSMARIQEKMGAKSILDLSSEMDTTASFTYDPAVRFKFKTVVYMRTVKYLDGVSHTIKVAARRDGSGTLSIDDYEYPYDESTDRIVSIVGMLVAPFVGYEDKTKAAKLDLLESMLTALTPK